MTKMILAVEAIKEITINPEKKIRGSKFFPGFIAISVFWLLLLLLLLLCLFFFCVHHCKDHFLNLILLPQFTYMIYRIFTVRSFFSGLITARIIFSINFISAVHMFVVISLRSILQILCCFQRVYCGNCLLRASFR